MEFGSRFLIQESDLTLKHSYPSGKRQLSFHRAATEFSDWRKRCKAKFAALLRMPRIGNSPVTVMRETDLAGVRIQALRMEIDTTLAVPAYLLNPDAAHRTHAAVLAIHGHGQVEPCIGTADDYHHRFALDWMDRSDIAGLNAPRPLALHYGELDTPGPENNSASYNGSVPQALKELKAIYAAAGAPDQVKLIVSKGKQHEMDVDALASFLVS